MTRHRVANPELDAFYQREHDDEFREPIANGVPPIADATGHQAKGRPSLQVPSPDPALDMQMAEAWLLDALPKVTGPLRTALSSALTEVRRERSWNRYVEGPDE